MFEIELKFQVPPDQARAVEAAVAGRSAARPTRLQAAYFDLPDRALAEARMALRVRREGTRWVQTLKALGDDGLTRLEHNVALDARGAAWPVVDPARHAGTPAGERLLALLRSHPGAALALQYRTDIRRHARVLRTGKATLELAFDRGTISAGAASIAVCELELELLRGPRADLLAAARRWQARHGLCFDTRSKAERGDLLARGERIAPPRGVTAVDLDGAASLGAARQRLLAACATQVLANASQIATGDHAPEHLHQLRVGLRRLRSGLRLFDAGVPQDDSARLADAAAAVFSRLGAARDQDVLSDLMNGRLGESLRLQVGADPSEPRSSGISPGPAPRGSMTAAADVVRSHDAQRLWLDLLQAAADAYPAAATEVPPPKPAPSSGAGDDGWQRTVTKRLNRWLRAACTDAHGFARLDDDARHRLRKRLKRLRYGLEFAVTLLRRRRLQRLLRRLQAAQQVLGELNDLAVASAALGRPDVTQPRAWFALGWIAARRESLLVQAERDLSGFARAGAGGIRRRRSAPGRAAGGLPPRTGHRR